MAIETNSFNPEEGLLTIKNRIITSEKRQHIKQKCVSIAERTINLPDVAIEAFNNELGRREEKRLSAGEKWNNESSALFTDNYGNRISVEALRHDIYKTRAMSGVNNFDLLNLRRNSIYLMAAHNIPLYQIKEYLGLKDEAGIPIPHQKTHNNVNKWRERVV